MKTIQKLFIIVSILFSVVLASNAINDCYPTNTISYLNDQESQYYTSIYGCPTILDYSCYTSGGCYSTEGAPSLPWGEFNGYIDKTYFVGGDCYDLTLNIDFNMVSTDQILIYEPNINGNMVVTAVVHGSNGFENLIYNYKNMNINREARVYIRVLKAYLYEEDDDPSSFSNCYYSFRGVFWWCYRN